MNDSSHNTLKHTVLEKIDGGTVTMRSKYRIMTFGLIAGGIAVAIFFLSVFILHYILFSIRINNQSELFQFGPNGWLAFFLFFPWTLLVLVGVLILVLQKMLRKFRAGYSIPIVYAGIVVLAGVVILGFIIDALHPDETFEHHGPRQMNGLYKQAAQPLPGAGICHCQVISIRDNIVEVIDARQGTATLKAIFPFDNPRATTTHINVEDVVWMAGNQEGTVIHVYGLRKAPQPVKQ